MKRYLPIAVISALITAAATAYCTTLLIDLFTASESFERGIALVICIIFFIFSAIAYLISSALAILGRVLCKRAGGGKMLTVYTVEAILPILLAAASYLILLFA